MLKFLFGRRATYLDGRTIDQVQALCREVEGRVNRRALHQQLLELFRRLSPSRRPRDVLRETWNFSLSKGSSLAEGQGVFLRDGRVTSAGQLVAIYPGTIYQRGVDPLLLPSIRNRFLLARKDQWIVDGRDRGLSRSIYLSCHSRTPQFDRTWLKPDIEQHRNPLTLGHYINHFPPSRLPNVTYDEFDFQLPEDDDLWRFVPHVRYAMDDADEDRTTMPSTVLLSLRPIEQDEELFSCYLNLIERKEEEEQ